MIRLPPPVAILLLLLLGARSLSAQEIAPGTTVRLTGTDSVVAVGELRSVDRDTALVLHAATGRLLTVPLASIRRLEVRERTPRGRGASRWAWRGFLAGAAAGTVACLADRENCTAETPDGSLSDGILSSAMFLGGAGAMFGAAGGALFPGVRWSVRPLTGFGDGRTAATLTVALPH